MTASQLLRCWLAYLRHPWPPFDPQKTHAQRLREEWERAEADFLVIQRAGQREETDAAHAVMCAARDAWDEEKARVVLLHSLSRAGEVQP